MKINAELVARLRRERSWSQDELAIAAGLNLRTVQRVEKDAAASLQTKKALAAAFDLGPRDLDCEEMHMKPCPVCGSDAIYQYKSFFPSPGSAGGETLLPGLGGLLSGTGIRPAVCADCGHIRLFADEAARAKLRTSKHWSPVTT